jgi:polar amino acid transport system substrate-binding protein
MVTRALALLGTLVVLAGCEGGGSSQSGSSSTSLIKQIEAAGVLRLGVAASPPLAYKDPSSGQWKGLYVDLMQDWTKNVLNVRLQFVQTTYGTGVAALQANQFDFMSAFTPAPKRTISVVFSNPVTYSIDLIAINTATTHVTTWDAFNNSQYSVCVQAGSTTDTTVTNLHANLQITRLPDAATCEAAVTSGRVNGYIDSWDETGAFAAKSSGVKLIAPPQPIGVETSQYATRWGYQYEDLLALNAEIDVWRASGALAASYKANGGVSPVPYIISEVPAYLTPYLAQFQ